MGAPDPLVPLADDNCDEGDANAIPVHTQICIATANVLTMRPRDEAYMGVSARRLEIAVQADRAGIQILGIQESRLRGQRVMTCHHYTMVMAGADPEGCAAGGVELWVHDSLGVTKDEIFLISFTPRYLVARITLGNKTFLVGVGHALDSSYPEVQVHTWWDTFGDALKAAEKPSVDCILLVDANGTLGSNQSPAVGGHHPDVEDISGARLHQLACELCLVIPQTFTECSVDGPSGTWSASNGRLRRIDYVLVPESWLHGITKAGPSLELDLALEDHLDHKAVVVSVCLVLTKPVKKTAIVGNREALTPPFGSGGARPGLVAGPGPSCALGP